MVNIKNNNTFILPIRMFSLLVIRKMKLFMIFIFFLACIFINAREGFRNENEEVFAYGFFGLIGIIGVFFVIMISQAKG